jgi:hypothetical protein
MKNLNPIPKYTDRYDYLVNEINPALFEKDRFLNLQEDQREKLISSLYNFYLAALGLSTLILRLAAIIRISEKFEDRTSVEKDISLIKVILQNLKDNKPTDTNWRNLLEYFTIISGNNDWIKWFEIDSKNHKSIFLEELIKYRNFIAHGEFSTNSDEIRKILNCFSKIRAVAENFKEAVITYEQAEDARCFYYIVGDKIKIKKTALYPFVSDSLSFNDDFTGFESDFPYLFQGLYEYEEGKLAKLINSLNGEEVKQTADSTKVQFYSFFQQLENVLSGNNGDSFKSSNENRLANYLKCIIGREKELTLAATWTKLSDQNNILPVFAPAGMGKGAFVAKLIKMSRSEKNHVNTIYHFCSTGLQNSLHAILYHLIITGKENGAWNKYNRMLFDKISKPPVAYPALIKLFQDLLAEVDNHEYELKENRKRFDAGYMKIPDFIAYLEKNFLFAELKSFCKEVLIKEPANIFAQKALDTNDFSVDKISKNVLVIIDGLDDAKLSFPNQSIADWFRVVDNMGNFTNMNWTSPPNIRWVFTYRHVLSAEEKGYRFPITESIKEIKSLQPLMPLDEHSVRDFLSSNEFFSLEKEVIDAVIEKGQQK